MEQAIDVVAERERLRNEKEEKQQDVVLRLEALKLAHDPMSYPSDVIRTAETYFNFLKGKNNG